MKRSACEVCCRGRVTAFLFGICCLCVASLCVASLCAAAEETRPTLLIGYTEGRNDLAEGQFANWVTNRACIVSAVSR